MGGLVFLLAGGAIYYRSHLQPTVAQSSSQAKFCNMTDGRKAALNLRSILEEIGIDQILPTEILAVQNDSSHESLNKLFSLNVDGRSMVTVGYWQIKNSSDSRQTHIQNCIRYLLITVHCYCTVQLLYIRYGRRHLRRTCTAVVQYEGKQINHAYR
jgi:hypothetical protein